MACVLQASVTFQSDRNPAVAQDADTSPAPEHRQTLADGGRSPRRLPPASSPRGAVVTVTSAVDWVPQQLRGLARGTSVSQESSCPGWQGPPPRCCVLTGRGGTLC